jgi:hypothetical protein
MSKETTCDCGKEWPTRRAGEFKWEKTERTGKYERQTCKECRNYVVCSRCGLRAHRSEADDYFTRRKDVWRGYQYECKGCRYEIHKERMARKREERREDVREGIAAKRNDAYRKAGQKGRRQQLEAGKRGGETQKRKAEARARGLNVEMPGLYHCNYCDEEKIASEFGTKTNIKDHICKDCKAASRRAATKRRQTTPDVPGGFISEQERRHAGICVGAGVALSDKAKDFSPRMLRILAEQVHYLTMLDAPDDPWVRMTLRQQIDNFLEEVRISAQRLRSRTQTVKNKAKLNKIDTLGNEQCMRARTVLGLGQREELTPERIRSAQRQKAMDNHPDRGGTPQLMAEINRAAQLLLENIIEENIIHGHNNGVVVNGDKE